MVANYKGKVFWTFGDTVCPRSARQTNCDNTGMYSVGATSCIPDDTPTCNAEDPPALVYFSQTSAEGVHSPLPLCPIPPMDQNTWLAGLVTLDSGKPTEALYSFFFKNPGDGVGGHKVSNTRMHVMASNAMRDSTDMDGESEQQMKVTQQMTLDGAGPPQEGIAKWDDDKRTFVPVVLWPLNTTFSLDKTVQVLSPADARQGFVYYASNGIFARMPATHDAMANFSALEILTSYGKVPPAWGSGSVNWNAYAQRYLYLGAGDGGLYVAFSHSLEGPWENGTLVATHAGSGSSCYNPLHLPHMDVDGGRVISFACTYTAMWSNTIQPSEWTTCLFGLNSRQNCAPVVPRYEYNNLIYRVDLAHVGRGW